jgi:hypothetical protein
VSPCVPCLLSVYTPALFPSDPINADLERRNAEEYKPIHVLNLETTDNDEDAVTKAGALLQLCKLVRRTVCVASVRSACVRTVRGWREGRNESEYLQYSNPTSAPRPRCTPCRWWFCGLAMRNALRVEPSRVVLNGILTFGFVLFLSLSLLWLWPSSSSSLLLLSFFVGTPPQCAATKDIENGFADVMETFKTQFAPDDELLYSQQHM